MDVPVNYLAVLTAAAANMVIGFVWYSYAMFAKPWMKEMGYTKEGMAKEQKKMGPMYVLSFVAALVMAYVLTNVMVFARSYMGTDAVMTGITTGFWMWLGFVAPVQMTDVIFGKKSWKLYYINTGYQLVSLLAMGSVIGLMR